MGKVGFSAGPHELAQDGRVARLRLREVRECDPPVIAGAVGVHEEEVLHFPGSAVRDGGPLFLDEPVQHPAQGGNRQTLRLEFDVEHGPGLAGDQGAHLLYLPDLGAYVIGKVEFVRRILECQRVKVFERVGVERPVELFGQV